MSRRILVLVAVLAAAVLLAACGTRTVTRTVTVPQKITTAPPSQAPETSITPNGSGNPSPAKPAKPPVGLALAASLQKTISADGLRRIIAFEGFEPCPYFDRYGGVWTRGAGETEGIRSNSPCISRAFGEQNLKYRLQRYYEWALRGLHVALNQNQWDALDSFAWNLGAGIFTGTTLGAELRSGQFNAAALNMLQYVHAGGVVLAGLVTRRRAEVALFLKATAHLSATQLRARRLHALHTQEGLRRALHGNIERHHCRPGDHARPRRYHSLCGRWLREGQHVIRLIKHYRRLLDPPAHASSVSTYGGYTASNPMLSPPGSSTSAFNQRIGTPTVLANSGEIVKYVLGLGSPMPANATSGPRWKHPTVYASNYDPIVTLQATKAWGTNPLTGRRIHAPAAWAAAPPKPSEGGDAHLEIVLAPVDERTPGETADLWQANPPSGGVLKFSWGSAANIAGSGAGGKATAADFDLWAGQVRGPELKAGLINHALCIVIKANKAGSYVYPAIHTDGTSTAYAAPKEGQRFQLNYSDGELAALPVKPWKRAILMALAHYGAYDCDSGGPGLAIELEGATMYTAFGQINPFNVIGAEQALPPYNGEYVFHFSEGVNWSRLRAIAPPAH